MTMPHLMNCPHSETGWCLECVKAEHDRTEALIAALRLISDSRRPGHGAFLDGENWACDVARAALQRHEEVDDE